MPFNIDTDPHPQLRYTVRLEYICPIYDEKMTEYLFMSEEEYFDPISYRRILDATMEKLNTLVYDGEEKIVEWTDIVEMQNTFNESEILSDAVLNLLKEGYVTFHNNPATESEISLALFYIYSIKDEYSRAKIKKEIKRLPFTPLKKIVDRILSIWKTSTRAKTRNDGTIETAWSKRDQELSKLLNEKCKDALEIFRKDLHRLNKQWGIRTEEDNYRRAVIIAKFLCDYPATKGLEVGFSEGMRVLCKYFGVIHTKYKRKVLIPTTETLEKLSKPQRSFQEQIREPWKDFISVF